METIKILLAAPYNGLSEVARAVAREWDDIELEVVECSDIPIREVLRLLPHRRYDAVVTRGLQVEDLRRGTDLPVVGIEFSPYDMIRLLKTADHVSFRKAIIGFQSLTYSAQALSGLFHEEIFIKTLDMPFSEEKIRAAIEEAGDLGFNYIIGDYSVNRIAKQLNMGGALFLSGPESVRKAFEEARYLVRLQQRADFHLDAARALLEGLDGYAAATDGAGRVLECTIPAEAAGGGLLSEMLAREDAALREQGERFTSLELDGRHWSIHGQRRTIRDAPVHVYNLRPRPQDAKEAAGVVEELYPDDIPNFYFHTVYNEKNEAMRALNEGILSYARTQLPVMVMGEPHVGKGHVAIHLHHQSGKQGTPLVIFHCALWGPDPGAAELERLLARYPAGATLFFEDLDRLSPELQRPVYRLVTSPAARPFRLLASAAEGWEALSSEADFYKKLARLFSELILRVPPLRERSWSLDGIARLLLQESNERFGRQVVGFSPAAAERLRSYPWYGNLTQMKHVIQRLVLTCSGESIQADPLSAELRASSASYRGGGVALDLSGTLSDITGQIVAHVFHEEDFNQSNTARRLGISRSTVWRILKQAPETAAAT